MTDKPLIVYIDKDDVDNLAHPDLVTAAVDMTRFERPFYRKFVEVIEPMCICGVTWEPDSDQFGCWSCGATEPQTKEADHD